MSARFYSIFMCLIVAIVTGCNYQQTWPDSRWYLDRKLDREFKEDPCHWIKDHQFVHDDHVGLVDGSYASIDSMIYQKPVDGIWAKKGILGLLNQTDNKQELALFIGLATYSNEQEYGQVKATFSDPLRLDDAKVKRGEHNWFSSRVELNTLPPTADAAIWMGYQGGVESGKEPLDLAGFINTEAGLIGSVYSQQYVEGNKYIYLKIIVVEETGHTELRKLLRKLDAPDSKTDLFVDVIDAGLGKDWKKVVTIVGSYAAAKEIREYLDQKELFDIEYAYESPRGATEIPVLHQRIWNQSNDPSLKLKLKIDKQWVKRPQKEPASAEKLCK